MVRCRRAGRMSPGIYRIGDHPDNCGWGRMIDCNVRGGIRADDNFPGDVQWTYSGDHILGLAGWRLKEWAGMQVVDVSLFLFQRFQNGIDTATELFSCGDPFIEDEATWNQPHDGGAWTGGTDAEISDTSHGRIAKLLQVTTSAATVDTWREFNGANLKAFIQKVLNGNGPTDWWARFGFFNNIGSGTDVRFRPREAGDAFATQRPYLRLEVSW